MIVWEVWGEDKTGAMAATQRKPPAFKQKHIGGYLIRKSRWSNQQQKLLKCLLKLVAVTRSYMGLLLPTHQITEGKEEHEGKRETSVSIWGDMTSSARQNTSSYHVKFMRYSTPFLIRYALVYCDWKSHYCNLHTPWSRVLLWEASWLNLQLIKKLPAFYGNPQFITVLTSARHLSLSWVNSIQSPQPPPTIGY